MGARAAILALAALGLGLLSPLVPARGTTTIGFWAGESVPGTDWNDPGTYWNRRATRAYTPGVWNVLRRRKIPLYFGLRYQRDFGPIPDGAPRLRDGLRLVRKANRLGVPVWGWILIPYSQGYWAWEGAAAEHFEAVKAVVGWARERKVRLNGIVLDPESPLNTPFEVSSAILGRGEELATLFGGTIDPARQCDAWHGYREILFWARRHRIKLSAAPAPAALDDLEDGLLGLQDAAEFIVPPGPWHELFFQAYRSVFDYYRGEDPGPGIVSSYLRSARHSYGRRGQVTLGSAGRGEYRRLENLVHDLRLLATLGARHVPIYSLERAVRAYGGPRALAKMADAARRPFTGRTARRATAARPRAARIREAIRGSDVGAADLTPGLTGGLGSPLLANSWPGGCG
jgi:hypothetical protein